MEEVVRESMAQAFRRTRWGTEGEDRIGIKIGAGREKRQREVAKQRTIPMGSVTRIELNSSDHCVYVFFNTIFRVFGRGK